jgi:hypothetical protein
VGSPKGRESYGDAGLVVVAGVTTCQGARESRVQGEGGQVTGHQRPGGMRNAERRDGAGCPPWLKRQKKAVLTDRIPERITYPRKELPLRLLKGTCEVCEQDGDVVVHHIRKLADLGRSGPSQPAWARLMAKRRRKTLVVCAPCHAAIHAEQPAALLTA